jgi:hypothetical protein
LSASPPSRRGFLVVAVKEHGENTTPLRRQATSAASAAVGLKLLVVGLGLLLGLLVVVGLGHLGYETHEVNTNTKIYDGSKIAGIFFLCLYFFDLFT